MRLPAGRWKHVVMTAGVIIGVAAYPHGAAASTIGITSALSIVEAGHIDWGTLGTSFSDVPNGFATPVVGVAGLTLTGTTATAGDMFRIDEGDWTGSFGPGEELLWSVFNGPLTFAFSSPVAGFGTQIAADTFGPYTARIEAFDASHASLGFFSAGGTATLVSDDSALFLGIVSSSANIRSVSIGLTATPGDPGDFAISRAVIQSDPIPEPTTLLLLGTGLTTVLVRNRRRQHA